MKLNKILLIFTAMFLVSSQLIAQGTVEGEVKNEKGEPVFNTIVRVNGAGKAKTDFDGLFSFQLAEGKYTLSFTNESEGYEEFSQDVDVKNGQITAVSIVMKLSSDVKQFETVIIKGVRVNVPSSVTALDEKRKNESGATDGITKETISNAGPSDAAAAAQMIPAVSIQDGKSVFVRGLGDRYTKTILNGMDIPGLDPDRNSVQLDIFPAVLIDNIIIYKTFTPNLSGDFTGGLVDIATKDFPTRKSLYVKGGFGYNTEATFNPDFITYSGGKFDKLGFDDGTRELPISPTTKIPHYSENNSKTTEYTNAFGKTMATEKGSSFLNQNYTLAIGNQIDSIFAKKPKITYGYNAVFNYRSTNTFYKEAEYNEYRRDPDSSIYEMFRDRGSKGSVAEQDVMWTGLIGQSMKFDRSKLSLVLFHTQNGVSTAADLRQINSESNPATLVKDGLTYSQRSISNINISGSHKLDSLNKWKLEWKVAPTYSRIQDPDLRSTALEEITDDVTGEVRYALTEAVGAEIRRVYRDLSEYNVSGKFDVSYDFLQWDSLESKLSFGFLNTYKNRSFDVSEYIFKVKGDIGITGDPNQFFMSENIWTPETDNGVYATGQQEKANTYDANQNIMAAYIMNDLPLSEVFKVTYGVRVEKNVNRYTGQSTAAETDPNAPRYNNEVVLDKLNVLPSLNMTYKIRKEEDSLRGKRDINIRGAFASTVARPSFREISISQIYDPIQGRYFLGNINLKQTLIHNADLRWEYFFGRTELISASAFYKKFINPIEVVAIVAAPNNLKPVNAGEADVYGGEFEIRKAIGFMNSKKQSLVAGFNFTYVISRIDMNKVETKVGDQVFTEKEVRQANAKVGEVVGDFRPMYGQSPYIVNSYLTYKHDSLGWMVNVSYNVQGKKLAVIGVGSLPDVYELPFHSLNLKISKDFGKIGEKGGDRPWSASIMATNLLDNAKRRYYEAYQSTSQIYDYLYQGMTFTGSISYTIK